MIFDEKKLFSLADSIWDEPELCFQEKKTSQKQQRFLKSFGFSISPTNTSLETAYIAAWGKGKPVIAFLAEMDALQNLSQKANAFSREPLTECQVGHGCGHHLLGAGSIGAAILYKEYLESQNLSGTVLVIGCPAEENGSGKSILAREGIFDSVDLALTWHPSIYNLVCSGSNQSYIQTKYCFKGIPSHAAVSPELGRSALDALELMNAGIARLREHLTPLQQIHYAITNAGGNEPAMIQAETEQICLVRAETPLRCKDLQNWVSDIAKGATLMTQTTVTETFLESASSQIPNLALDIVLDKAFQQTALPDYTGKDLQYLNEYKKMAKPEALTSMLPPNVMDPESLRNNILTSPICDIYVHCRHSKETFPGSSDVGDVSQMCPTGIINTACFSFGTFPHSWMWTAQGKSDPAHAGMLYAARVLARSACMIADDPTLLDSIQKEWDYMKKRQM